MTFPLWMTLLATWTPSAIVFASMFVLDFVWTHYTKAIQNHLPFPAASWAVAITGLNGLAQIGYVADPWLLIPAAAGAFGGTYSAMKLTRKETT